MGGNWPIVLIEVVLIFGGVLAFGWWQLREVSNDQRKAAAERLARQRAEASPSSDGVESAATVPAAPPSVREGDAPPSGPA